MDIYKLTNDGVDKVKANPFALEKDIQLLVEENLEQLFNLQMVTSEFRIANYRFDTLAFDEESSSFVIVEYKKGHSYSVIDQGYTYLATMLGNKAEVVLEYNEKLGRSLRRDDVDWSSSRVIFVSPSFNSYQKDSVNFKDVPFELWEIKRYSDDTIILDPHKSTSGDSIEALGETNKAITAVASEVKVWQESDHLNGMTEKTLTNWQLIKDHFDGLEGVSYNVRSPYISIVKGSVAVCFVHFRKAGLRIDVIRGGKSADGSLSKGYFNIDDPKGLALQHLRPWKDGERHQYVIEVEDDANLDEILELLMQKFHTL